MEGDAGAERPLNLTDADDSSRSELTPHQTSPEVTPEDSAESEGGADQTSTEVTPEDSAESEGGADQTSTETADDSTASGDAADQLSCQVTFKDPTESEDHADQGPDITPEADAESEAELGDGNGYGNEADAAVVGEPIPSRLGRGWLIAIAALFVLLAGGGGFGGYLALRFHLDSQSIARNDAAAIQAAKDCVAATQAPDTAAMADAARRIIECSTGDFGAQAALYSGMLAEAYQAANARVEVSDMRAAVERNNPDGSVDVLVALRTKVTNSSVQGQEQGYRLRVTMSRADDQYKISKLDQVAK